MNRKNLYLVTPCCQAKCVYPSSTCKGCEYAIDNFSVLFENVGINILCFL